MQGIADKRILETFTQSDMTTPSARKVINGHTIYRSRHFELPEEFGDVVLGDLGSEVKGDEKRNHDAQPEVYRSPETMLKVDWNYMIWDLFERRQLFYGQDPDGKGYSTRAHLAEVIALLGPPPLDLIEQGARSDGFFTKEGKWRDEDSEGTSTGPVAQQSMTQKWRQHADCGEKISPITWRRAIR